MHADGEFEVEVYGIKEECIGIFWTTRERIGEDKGNKLQSLGSKRTSMHENRYRSHRKSEKEKSPKNGKPIKKNTKYERK